MAKKTEAIALDDWIDRDLSESARQGLLAPAFEVDDTIRQAEEILQALGNRSPVFLGPPGIGKTAVIHELLRRAYSGEGIPFLVGARVVQISLRAIRARFKTPADATTFFGEFCNAIVASNVPIVPYIRDIHLAYPYDWEPILHRLVTRLPHPILGEGAPNEYDALIEYWPDLTQNLVSIPVVEPVIPVVRRIVDDWCKFKTSQHKRKITPAARRIAIELTARFMGDKPFPRKVLELLRQTLDFTEGKAVDVPHVVRRFSQITRVPARLVDPKVQLDLAEVRSFVADRLLGQEEAVDAVVRMIALIKAGLADLRRPLGTFMFVGPTGVGKTYCAQLLAEHLFGARDRLIRINMGDYSKAEDAQVLFGWPNASKPKEQRGVLAGRLSGHPFGVLLLDEFEKAHESIHDRFLQLVDEGAYINGRGETVSVSSLIVIATSNAGADVYRKAGLGFDPEPDLAEQDRELDRRLAQIFRFEFLNRFDRIAHFHPLTRVHIRAIARRELTELSQREGLIGRGLQVEVDAEVLDWLVAHGYHPHYGARFLRREIERSVAGTLAEFIVKKQPERDSRIGIGVRRDRIHARLPPADKTEVVTEPGVKKVRLNRQQLLTEASAWLARWEPLIREFEERQDLASRLIEASNERGFWDDVERAQEVLKRYKTIDARLQTDKRLMKPLGKLQQAVERTDDTLSTSIGGLVEELAVNYRRWIDLGTAGGSDSVWLTVGPADPLNTASEWLVDLVAMYRGWLRRKGYNYDVIAEEVGNGEVVRLVMEVDGPGIGKLLEMEDGEHRRRIPNGGSERALVTVIPRRTNENGKEVELPPGVAVEDARRTRGVAVPRRTVRLKIVILGRGLTVVLHGNSRPTLEALSVDLTGTLAAPPTNPVVVRTYGLKGGLVRDPRTSASSGQLKDVSRGNLEVFLRAWEVR